jgi:N-methylhydantoinase B
MTKGKIDPLRLEVLKNAFISITEEISATVQRSAYSTNIKTRKDFSCALCDKKLRVIAQSFSQPAHLGVLVGLIPTAVTSYGVERLQEGDIIAVNDPYHRSSHLNDIALISPVFHEGELFGYMANIAHHVDVGGGAPASVSISRELYQEGIIIPPVKLFAQGELNKDLFQFLVRNVRAKREVSGDIRAQIAGNRAGIQRMKELLTKYGEEMLSFYIEELMNYTEKRTRQEFQQFPHGEYSGEDFLDDDGFTDQPIRICVKVIIDKNGITLDFGGTDPQRRSPMNATLAFTFTGVSQVLKSLISDDVPVNDGFYRCINIKAPLGSVVNATEPSGVVGGYEVGMRVISALWKAFAQAVPDKIMAGSKGAICHAGFGGYDPIRNEPYAFLETIGGGIGGRKGKDGIDGCQADLSNTENAPIEETEMNYPVRIVRYELIPDSGGVGQFRGGLGIRRDYQFPYEKTIFTILSDRAKFPPWGIFGGKDGVPSKYFREKESVVTPLKSKCTFEVEPGEIISFQTAGGGGYGDPKLRAPEAIRNDILNGKISPESAKADYGFIFEEKK